VTDANLSDKAAATVDSAAEAVKDAASTAMASVEKTAPPVRSTAQIEADLDVVRARLAGRIDDLEDYVAPENVAKRGVASVKRVFVDEYGGIKPDRVLMAAGVVVLLVGLRAAGRRRRSR